MNQLRKSLALIVVFSITTNPFLSIMGFVKAQSDIPASYPVDQPINQDTTKDQIESVQNDILETETPLVSDVDTFEKEEDNGSTYEDLAPENQPQTQIKGDQVISNLVSNVTYKFEKNSKVQIRFTNLPSENSHTLSISEVTVKVNGIDSKGYKFESTMQNGTFSYNMQLPNPYGSKALVQYSEDGMNFLKLDSDNINNEVVRFTLDHFTIFVVVNPNLQTNCDGVIVGTIEDSTCFSTIQAAINAAATDSSTPHTIYVAPGIYNEEITIPNNANLYGLRLFGAQANQNPNYRSGSESVVNGWFKVNSGVNWVEINGFEINVSSNPQPAFDSIPHGLAVDNASNVYFTYNKVNGAGHTVNRKGVTTSNGTSNLTVGVNLFNNLESAVFLNPVTQNASINSNTVINTSYGFRFLSSNNIVIQYNSISTINPSPTSSGIGIQIRRGWSAGAPSSTGIVVNGNNFVSQGAHIIHADDGINGTGVLDVRSNNFNSQLPANMNINDINDLESRLMHNCFNSIYTVGLCDVFDTSPSIFPPYVGMNLGVIRYLDSEYPIQIPFGQEVTGTYAEVGRDGIPACTEFDHVYTNQNVSGRSRQVLEWVAVPGARSYTYNSFSWNGTRWNLISTNTISATPTYTQSGYDLTRFNNLNGFPTYTELDTTNNVFRYITRGTAEGTYTRTVIAYSGLAGSGSVLGQSEISATDLLPGGSHRFDYDVCSKLTIDRTLPTISIVNDVEAGPVQFDIINVVVSDLHPNTTTYEYGFSTDAVCDESDSYGNSFTSGVDFVINSMANNGLYLCLRASDMAGNTVYSVSSNTLNILPPSAPVVIGFNEDNGSGDTPELPRPNMEFGCLGGSSSSQSYSTHWTHGGGDYIKFQREYRYRVDATVAWSAWSVDGVYSNQYTDFTNFVNGEGLYQTRVVAFVDIDNNDEFDTGELASDWSNICQIRNLNNPEPAETHSLQVCKADTNNNELSGWEINLQRDGITLSASDVNPVITSITGLNTGNFPAGTYRINVSGTYRYGNSQMIADAGYSYRPASLGTTNLGCDCWFDGDQLGYFNPSWYGALKIKVNNTNINWGTYNSSHEYSFDFVHSGGDLILSSYDNSYGDNTNIDMVIEILPLSLTQTTSDNGCTVFENLLSGSYSLSETMQSNWEFENRSDGYQNGDVISIPDQSLVTFVNRSLLNSIEGTKLNGETSEEMSEWRINLYNSTWNLIDSAESTPSYSFDNLPSATYYVCEENKSGWTQTLPLNLSSSVSDYATAIVNMSSNIANEAFYCWRVIVDIYDDNTVYSQINFENSPMPTPTVGELRVCKENEDGDRLSGWEFNLDRNGGVIASGSFNASNASGTIIPNLPAGTYEVTVSGTYNYRSSGTARIADAGYSRRNEPDLPMWLSGYHRVAGGFSSNGLSMRINDNNPADPMSGLINWGPFNELHSYTIYYNHPGGDMKFSIRDNQYSDNSAGNIQILVSGFFGDTTTISGTTIDTEDENNGCVVFQNLLVGEYNVYENIQEGWEFVSRSDERNNGDSTMIYANEPTNLTFINREIPQEYSISGTKHLYMNGEYVGTPTWAFFLFDSSWNLGDIAVIDPESEDSLYTFENLTEGSYFVCEMTYPSSIITMLQLSPNGSEFNSVELNPDANDLGLEIMHLINNYCWNVNIDGEDLEGVDFVNEIIYYNLTVNKFISDSEEIDFENLVPYTDGLPLVLFKWWGTQEEFESFLEDDEIDYDLLDWYGIQYTDSTGSFSYSPIIYNGNYIVCESELEGYSYLDVFGGTSNFNIVPKLQELLDEYYMGFNIGGACAYITLEGIRTNYEINFVNLIEEVDPTPTPTPTPTVTVTPTPTITVTPTPTNLVPSIVLFGNFPASNISGIVSVPANTNFTITGNQNTVGNPNFNYSFGEICSGSISSTSSTFFVSNTLNLAPGNYTCTIVVSDTDGDTANASITIVAQALSVGGPGPVTESSGSVEGEETQEEGSVLGEEELKCEISYPTRGYVYVDSNSNDERDDNDLNLENMRVRITTIILDDEGEEREVLVGVYTTNKLGEWSSKLCPGKYFMELISTPDSSKVRLIGERKVEILVTENESENTFMFIFEELKVEDSQFPWWLILVLGLTGAILFIVSRRKEEEKTQ